MTHLIHAILIFSLGVTSVALGETNGTLQSTEESLICYRSTQVGTLLSSGMAVPVRDIYTAEGQVTGTECSRTYDTPSKLICEGEDPKFSFGSIVDYTCVPLNQKMCSEARFSSMKVNTMTLCVGSEQVGRLERNTLFPVGSDAATGSGCGCENRLLSCNEIPYRFPVELTKVRCINSDEPCASRRNGDTPRRGQTNGQRGGGV